MPDFNPTPLESTFPPPGRVETNSDLAREVKKLRKELKRYNKNCEDLLRLYAVQTFARSKRRRSKDCSPLLNSPSLGLLEVDFPYWEGLKW